MDEKFELPFLDLAVYIYEQRKVSSKNNSKVLKYKTNFSGRTNVEYCAQFIFGFIENGIKFPLEFYNLTMIDIAETFADHNWLSYFEITKMKNKK